MASRLLRDSYLICPVCFESQDVLKTVGRCGHSFCITCITAHIKRLKCTFESFPCPTCKAECPFPPEGLIELPDFTGADDKSVVVNRNPNGKPKESSQSGKQTLNGNLSNSFDVKCQVCFHRNKEVQAVDLCPECDQLYLCQDCTKVHTSNSATKDHVVVRVKTMATKGQEMCTKHHAPLTSYCCECKEPACKICVLVDHGHHKVEKLSDMIQAKYDKVKAILQKRESELKAVKSKMTALTELNVLGLERENSLIKEIEDHAEKCINEIVTWKETVKENIKTDFSVVNDIEDFKERSDTVEKLQGSFAKANSLLSKVEHQTAYLNRLSTLQDDLSALGAISQVFTKEDGEECKTRLLQLQHTKHIFVPAPIPKSIGKVEKIVTAGMPKAKFEPELIVRQVMQSGSSHYHFIPCIANLGEKYAVANPTGKGQPSRSIDIFEFPGKYKRTLIDKIYPLYDMSSTPDGKIAVLSDGIKLVKGKFISRVKVFDPEKGYLGSTPDLDIGKPLSLSVRMQNQYVILSDKARGQKQVTVVDKDGRLESTHEIDVGLSKLSPGTSRITCGLKYIFAMALERVEVYELQGKELVHVSTILEGIDLCLDISATIWDHVYVADLALLYDNKLFQARYTMKDGQNKWDCQCNRVGVNMRGVNRECRISVKGKHVVMSYGQTLVVYKI